MSSDDDVPSASECEARCKEFADITGTDTALAMFYLQDRDWNVERSLNAFFETASVESKEKKSVVAKSGDRIRLLSWNIDGLDDNNVETRAKAVVEVIKKENPHIVYLQELVPKNYKIISESLPDYRKLPTGDEGYFTAVLLKTDSANYTDHAITPFYSSRMARNLIEVKAKVQGVEMHLMTSHLESTKPHAAERKRQLQTCLTTIGDVIDDATVLFAGDMNLRDSEIDELGGLPKDVLDVWEVTGKRPEAKYTWDLRRNDNKEMPGRFQPQSRFDRMYLRHSASRPRLKPVYFELVGLERLPTCRRFASDHWGILGHFDVMA